MSEKDKIIQLLDYVPEYKLGYVLAYVQGILIVIVIDAGNWGQIYKKIINTIERNFFLKSIMIFEKKFFLCFRVLKKKYILHD